MYAKHRALHVRLSARFSSDTIEKWEQVVQNWECKPTLRKNNPFVEPTSSMFSYLILARLYLLILFVGSTLTQVKLELAKEEMEDAKWGITPLHDVSPNAFLTIGFDLEEQQ
jgi:hypothetical protein